MKTHYLQLVISLTLVSGLSKEQDFIPEYKPFSTAIIELQVSGNPLDTLYAEVTSIQNIPRKSGESGEIMITSEGKYHLLVEVDRPAQSHLSLNDTIFNIITRPNDTTFIIVNRAGRLMELQFMGRDKKINEYLFAKKKALGYADMRMPLNKRLTSKTKYHQILSNTDSLVNRELNFLDQYQAQTKLPEWFVQYENAEIEYMGAGFKLAMTTNNEILGYFEDALPSNYYDFLSSVDVDNEKAILSAKYYWFLDDYFMQGLAYKEFEQLAGYARASKILGHQHSKAKNRLSGQVKNIYNQYMFSTIVQKLSDTLKIDSIAREFEIENPQDFKRLYGSNDKKEQQFKNLKTDEQVIEFFAVNTIDTLTSIRDFSDKIVYINFWATWCGPCLKNIPDLNNTITEYSNNNEIVFLNICVNSGKDTWRKTITKKKLKGINLFAEGKWEKKLFSEFNITGLPTYVLLNRGNKLFENHTDKAPVVKSKINKLLEKNGLDGR